MNAVRAVASWSFDGARLVRRALLLWLLARLVVLAALRAFALPPAASLIVIGATAVLCHVDARVMREPIFFANLGRPAWLAGAVGAAVALLLELSLAIAFALAT